MVYYKQIKSRGDIMTEKIWKSLCEKYNKHCYYSEVANMSVEEAERYIKSLQIPLDFGR